MEPSDPSLLETLQTYSAGEMIPMHMPGHKRNTDMTEALKLLGARFDITEIEGFDNLHNASGLLASAMERSAHLWHSLRSFFLVNGSTCGILAGIRTLTRYGGKILMPRGCHKAVYHAVELCGLEPVFLLPPIDEVFGIYGSVRPEQVEEALKFHPDICLVVLTSPTYEGVISDIASICRIAHKRNIPVMVDEAHGAHLGFSPLFSGGAVAAGADLVIQSLHKTLPSLTQTAIAHLNSPRVDPVEFARQLGIFETSSPSYLLMSSMDCCVRLLESQGNFLFSHWEERLRAFDAQIMALSRLRVLCHGRDIREQHPRLFGFDPSKLVISARGTGLTGPALAGRLRSEHHIELEMASGDYAIAMTGLGDRPQWLSALADALIALDETCEAAAGQMPAPSLPPIPHRVCGIARALEAEHRSLPENAAVGAVSAEYVWAYPPGIPLLIPGEQISGALLRTLRTLSQQGVCLTGTCGKVPACYETADIDSAPDLG